MLATLNLSAHFADKIAEIVLNNRQNPLDMAQTLIILPTKRACRSVKEAFVRRCENKPILMPQIKALFDADDLIVDIPPAISELERLFLLTRLCQAKPNVDSLDKALKIAMSLCKLLDEFYTYEVSFDNLIDLVEEQNLAIHWQESILFLDILKSVWPSVLAEKGKIDAVDRNIRLINHLTSKINTPIFKQYVILAGFDGETPAIKRLIKTLSLKNNALILFDGLNKKIEKDEEKNLTTQHYQQTLYHLLHYLKKTPNEIPDLSVFQTPQETLIHEALKPAEQTDEWRYSQITADVLQNVYRIDCENLNEEALIIASIMRTVLETPEKTAALVTNDRNLSRRVIAEMKRWGIELDDSAGTPLNHTPIGVYMSLIADYGTQNGSGCSALALLKHPLCADFLYPTDLRLEVKKIEKEARQKNEKFIYPFQTDMKPFLSFFEQKQPVPFVDILNEHLKIAELLATSSDRTGIERLWETDTGETAYQFFMQLKEEAKNIGNILPKLYAETLTLLMTNISVRPKYGMHPRLDVLGPIEARLSHPDVCIIGGLNEGSFPQLPESGPWLSRQMRKKIGLPSPEKLIAVQSMDFAHCFCAKEVYLTRSLKADGSQTIPSRFLSRLEAVLQGAGIDWPLYNPSWVAQLTIPEAFEKIERPAPVPPKELRPTQLSVTGIETLMRNPYGLYARRILKLYPLEDLENFSETKTYGTAIHTAIEKSVSEQNVNQAYLVNTMQITLRDLNASASMVALLRPKMENVARFIIERQKEKAPLLDTTFVETSGSFDFKLDDGTLFTLTAKADRIDVINDGSVEIIDYKTGTLPSQTDIKKGYSPQLPLEGLIVQQGGFKEIGQKKDIKLTFWKLDGKKNGGTIQQIGNGRDKIPVSEIIQNSFEGIKNLLNAYNNDTMPYEAYPKPKLVKYDDYAHLARVKEWLSEDDESEE